MKWLWRSLLLFVCVVAPCAVSIAQADIHAAFEVAVGEIFIGQPFELTLVVNAPSGIQVDIPTFGVDWSPFMVQDEGEISQQEANGRVTFRKVMRVILWGTGDFQTAEVRLTTIASDGSTGEVIIPPRTITVRSVLQAGDETIRPLKPQLDMPYLSPMWGVVVLGILAIVGFYAWRWWAARAAQAQAAGLHPAAWALLKALERLEKANLEPQALCVGVAEGLRGYLRGRFGRSVAEMTTAELAAWLVDGAVVSAERETELVNLFEQIDLVKFAQTQPKSVKRVLDFARQWVLNVERDRTAKEAA